MTLAQWIRSFFYDDPRQIFREGEMPGIPVDAELAARNAARQKAAREALGEKWIGAAKVTPIDTARRERERIAGPEYVAIDDRR